MIFIQSVSFWAKLRRHVGLELVRTEMALKSWAGVKGEISFHEHVSVPAGLLTSGSVAMTLLSVFFFWGS